MTTYLDFGIQAAVREDCDIVSEGDSITDDRKRPYRHVLSYSGGGRYDGGRVNAAWMCDGGVKEGKGLSEGQVWIGREERREGGREIVGALKDNGGSESCSEMSMVLGIAEKGEVSGSGGFD